MVSGRVDRHLGEVSAPNLTVCDQSGEIRTTVLTPGVRVATELMPGLRSASIGFWMTVGSRDESTSEAGATHFLEHLVFRGTATRTGRMISEEIDALGGEVNAFTAKEHTCFHARVMVDDVSRALALLADLVYAASLQDDAVDAEREVILKEVDLYQDSSDVRVHWLWAESFFAGHPLSHSSLGSLDDIRRLRADDLRRWYDTHYTLTNLVVTAAGGIDHDAFVEEIQIALRSARPAGATRPARSAPKPVPRHPVEVHAQASEQTHLVLGTLTVPRSSPDRYTVGVIAEALGGGMGSRLYQEVRERRSLAYVVYAHPAYETDHGTLEVYVSTTPDRAGEAVELIAEEWTRLVRHGMQGGELERQKANLRRSVALSLENSASRMNRLGKAVLSGAPLLGLEENLAQIAAVTTDDAHSVLESMLTGPYALVALGAAPSEDALHRAMRPLTARSSNP